MLEEWNLRKTNERLQPMICIVVKFKVKPDWSERWLGLVEDFTQATRKEPGNLWFDWSRSVDDATWVTGAPSTSTPADNGSETPFTQAHVVAPAVGSNPSATQVITPVTEPSDPFGDHRDPDPLP